MWPLNRNLLPHHDAMASLASPPAGRPLRLTLTSRAARVSEAPPPSAVPSMASPPGESIRPHPFATSPTSQPVVALGSRYFLRPNGHFCAEIRRDRFTGMDRSCGCGAESLTSDAAALTGSAAEKPTRTPVQTLTATDHQPGVPALLVRGVQEFPGSNPSAQPSAASPPPNCPSTAR
jgi:hypothetical protein